MEETDWQDHGYWREGKEIYRREKGATGSYETRLSQDSPFHAALL